jgi:hypothetical protein
MILFIPSDHSKVPELIHDNDMVDFKDLNLLTAIKVQIINAEARLLLIDNNGIAEYRAATICKDMGLTDGMVFSTAWCDIVTGKPVKTTQKIFEMYEGITVVQDETTHKWRLPNDNDR